MVSQNPGFRSPFTRAAARCAWRGQPAMDGRLKLARQEAAQADPGRRARQRNQACVGRPFLGSVFWTSKKWNSRCARIGWKNRSVDERETRTTTTRYERRRQKDQFFRPIAAWEIVVASFRGQSSFAASTATLCHGPEYLFVNSNKKVPKHRSLASCNRGFHHILETLHRYSVQPITRTSTPLFVILMHSGNKASHHCLPRHGGLRNSIPLVTKTRPPLGQYGLALYLLVNWEL